MYDNYEPEKNEKKKGFGWLLKTTIGAAVLAIVINQGHALYSRMNCSEVYIEREDPELIERIEENHNISDITSIIEKKRYCASNDITDYMDRLRGGEEILDYREMR